LTGVELDLLIKLNELAEYARRGDEFLADEFCNFLVNEFDLTTVILFDVAADNSLNVIGKSAKAPNNFRKGASFNCSVCKNLSENVTSVLVLDPNCGIQISDSPIYEACSFLQLNNTNNMLIKLARKSAFTKNDSESVEKAIQLLSAILQLWVENRGGSKSLSTSFSSIVTETAHELKSVSNSIISYANMLSNENLTSPQAEYISIIKKNAQNILISINDLSELSKIAYNGLSGIQKNISINNLVNEVVELFRSRFGTQKIHFTVNITKELDRPIEVDDQKLRYILCGLLIVATTLTTQGEILLKVFTTDDNKIRFVISDSGKVLANELINKIFEPFTLSKIDDFKNSFITGLSLTLVKKFVNYLGGEISASSSQEKGNSFTFTISGELMSALENNFSQLAKSTAKNKVLVIEDDYAISKLLSNYLNKWGYNPTIVSTKDQAFSVINKEQVLAIIMDIDLPNANGLEMLKKIHGHHNAKNTPVIVCSVEPELQKAFMMGGAAEYFVKPINYNYLMEVLTSYKLRKNLNILCVDDDLTTLNLVKQAIESAGFIPVAENISANVINLIRDKDIDFAIINLEMPTPNGFKLIKMIKADKKFTNLPIIIYSGKENYKDDLYKIEGLFEELLDKPPTNIEDLAATINTMINRYEVPPSIEEVLHKDNVIKILLAEDYKHSQIIVTRLLKKHNFENVIVVENGEDAVKMAKQEKFDLILMDIQMPIMNGLEATEKIRKIPEYKETPVIALTAFAMKGDREKCIEAGATDYIPKPIDSKEFIEKVRYYTNIIV